MAKKNRVNGIGAFADSKTWAIEDDLRTLQRAEEIEADPKRMKAVRELAKEKLVAMASIASGEDD